MTTCHPLRRLALLAALLPSFASAAPAVPEKLGFQGRLLKADGTPESGVVQVGFSLFAQSFGGTPLWSESQQLALSDGFYATALGDATPLVATVFDGSELFLEVSVGGSALSPRQRLSSVAYTLRARQAVDVAGGRVDASSISVGGRPLVGADGKLDAASLSVGGREVVGADGKLQAASVEIGGKQVIAADGKIDAASLSVGGKEIVSADAKLQGSSLWIAGKEIVGSDGKLAAGVAYTAGPGLRLTANAFSLPTSCGSNEILKWNGSDWACSPDAGGLPKVTASAPLTGEGTAASPLGLAVAGASSDGYLTSADWAAFSGKVSAVKAGAGVSVTGGSAPEVSVVYGDAPGTAAQGNDPRLSDARAPKSGSPYYIQAQTGSTQSAGFKIDGTATVGALATTAGATVGGELLANGGLRLAADTTSECTTGKSGALRWTGKFLQVCTQSGWITLGGEWPGTQGNPGTSCKGILEAGGARGDGVYWIDPDGAGTGADPFQVFCDMTTDGGGWTLVMNVAPADGNSVGYNNQNFWTRDAEYGSFSGRLSNDYKSPAAYLLAGTQLMIQSAGAGTTGSVLGWRRWPMTSTRTLDSFFSTGIVGVHGSDSCETGSPDAVNVGSTSAADDIIRQGGCLYADVNPSSSGEGDTIRLTTIPGNNTDNKMSGFASCIDCGSPWQGSYPYMGLDRAACGGGVCAYNEICRVPGADCLGNYCSSTYSSSSCGMVWNSRFYVR